MFDYYGFSSSACSSPFVLVHVDENLYFKTCSLYSIINFHIHYMNLFCDFIYSITLINDDVALHPLKH